PAAQDVGTTVAIDPVVELRPVDVLEALEDVGVEIAVGRGAERQVDGHAARVVRVVERVDAGAAEHLVVTLAAVDPVVVATAEQDIVVGAAEDLVIAGLSLDEILIAERLYDVVELRSDECIRIVISRDGQHSWPPEADSCGPRAR